MLRVLSAKKRRAFYESQLGKEKEILLEGNFKEGYMTGFTENYVKVKTLWDPELINTKHRVRLEKIDKDGSVLFKTLTQEPILA